MSNEMLKLAEEIKEAAFELEGKGIKDMPIVIDEKTKRRVSDEIIAYKTFLRKFLNIKGNDEILGVLKPLFDNPTVRKPKNTILQMIDSSANRKQKQTMGDTDDVLDKIRDIELKTRSRKLSLYPGLKLLKEILNYGVVKGVNTFKILLSRPGILKSTFRDEENLKGE